jgi:hypothetical protein
MRDKLDHFWIGVLLGLLAPSMGIIIFYYTNFPRENMKNFIEISVREKMLSPLLSLCAVINLGVFYLFIHFEKYLSARGIIFSTFAYGFLIVVLKFFY